MLSSDEIEREFRLEVKYQETSSFRGPSQDREAWLYWNHYFRFSLLRGKEKRDYTKSGKVPIQYDIYIIN